MGLKSPRGNLGQLSGLAFVRRLPKVLLRKVGEKVLRNKRLSPPVSQTRTLQAGEPGLGRQDI